MRHESIAFSAFFIFLALLFSRPVQAGESFLNEPNGFRGIAWGTPLSENKDEMIFVKTNVGIDIFSRRNSKMSIGDAPLSELHYGYSKNGFMVVYIKTAGKENASLLRKELEKHFGPGPWDGRTGTVVPLRDGASIYSTVLMQEQFQQIEAEVNVLMKQLKKKHSGGQSNSDF